MAIPEQLISRLSRLTENRKLNWEAVGMDSFKTTTGNMTVAVRERGNNSFVLSVYDDDGNLLDRADSGEGDSVWQLYDAARRLSLNVDGKIAALDAALSKLEHS